MNVLQVILRATLMLCVITFLERIDVNVTLGLLEMALIAQVSLLWFSIAFTYNECNARSNVML